MRKEMRTVDSSDVQAAIDQRAFIVKEIDALPMNSLVAEMSNYGALVRKNTLEQTSNTDNTRQIIDDEIGEYHFREMNRYPVMDLRLEAILGKIIELERGKRISVHSEEAESYLLGYKLRWIWTVANGYAGGTNNSLNIPDLYQEGCTRLAEILPEWDWRRSALSTYAFSPVRQSMLKAISENLGRTSDTSWKIALIKKAKTLWLKAKEDEPSNESLATAMVLYYLQPDMKVSNKDKELHSALMDLIDKLKIFRDKDKELSAEYLIARATGRLDLFLEIDKKSHNMEADSFITDADEGATLLDLIGVGMDKSHLAEGKIIEYEKLVEGLFDGLTDREEQAVRFILFSDIRNNRPIGELVKLLGVKLDNAKRIYYGALKKMRNNKEAVRKLKLFFDDEGLIDLEY